MRVYMHCKHLNFQHFKTNYDKGKHSLRACLPCHNCFYSLVKEISNYICYCFKFETKIWKILMKVLRMYVKEYLLKFLFKKLIINFSVILFFSNQTMKTRELLMSRIKIMSISSCDYFSTNVLKERIIIHEPMLYAEYHLCLLTSFH
jgi:hypothetical protein